MKTAVCSYLLYRPMIGLLYQIMPGIIPYSIPLFLQQFTVDSIRMGAEITCLISTEKGDATKCTIKIQFNNKMHMALHIQFNKFNCVDFVMGRVGANPT